MIKHQRIIWVLVILLGVTAFSLNGITGDAGKTDQVLIESAQYSPVDSVHLPKLIDLGSKSCIPCRKMAPILDSLSQEYNGKAEIIFIDVRENRQAAIDFKITLIPTQVFLDTAGTEIYRHIGFFPADSITTHLKELGAEL